MAKAVPAPPPPNDGGIVVALVLLIGALAAISFSAITLYASADITLTKEQKDELSRIKGLSRQAIECFKDQKESAVRFIMYYLVCRAFFRPFWRGCILSFP